VKIIRTARYKENELKFIHNEEMSGPRPNVQPPSLYKRRWNTDQRRRMPETPEEFHTYFHGDDEPAPETYEWRDIESGRNDFCSNCGWRTWDFTRCENCGKPVGKEVRKK
tara:strand:- start:1049 stop:1378 length:330 start_codon:yes stop_codon:yes gene_type:complete